MKRTLIFKHTDNFVFCENDDVVIKIDGKTLEIDEKALYENLFKDLDELPEIHFQNNYEIINNSEEDNKATRIYETVNDIVTTIIKKLSEDKVFEGKVVEKIL